MVQNYNTCHANLKRDIRSFDQTITYSFYIKSDTFPRADLYPPDSCVSILYDTTKLKYENSKWSLYEIKLTSYSGYLGVWDEWYRYLVTNGEFGTFQVGQIPLIFENNPYIDYWGNPCGSGDKVMKFELEVHFSLRTGMHPENKKGKLEYKIQSILWTNTS